MKNNKFIYIIPSIIISVIITSFIYWSKLTDTKEKISVKESIIEDLEIKIEDQKEEINSLKEENENLEKQISELQEDNDLPLNEENLVVIAPQG